jgi:CheY-like chemotaxis protein
MASSIEKELSAYKWQDKTVLIVEDEEINIFYFEELLLHSGIKIIIARSGPEALQLCEENPEIDLVLMDIKMPKMDGFEATERIKKMNPDIPVIAQTAHVLESEKKRCFEVGCSEYIAKPIDGAELFKRMSIFLDK